jgi:hypothetical protein
MRATIGRNHESYRRPTRQRIALTRGEHPERGIVNPEVFERRSFGEKWARLQRGDAP